MKLEESIRAHIDGAAPPITLAEIKQPDGSLLPGALQTIAILDPDSIAPVEDLDPFSGRASGHEIAETETVEIKHGIRPIRWLQAAAVFLAVGLSATAVLWIRDGQSVGLDATGTTGTQAAAALATMEEAANATADSWTQIDDPDGVFVAPDITELIEITPLQQYSVPDWYRVSSFYLVNDIQRVSSGYYAVGTLTNDYVSIPIIWRSEDAAVWEQLLGPEESYADLEFDSVYSVGSEVLSIAERAGTIVAVGTRIGENNLALAWTKTKNDEWQAVELPRAGAIQAGVTSIVVGDNGFVVAGVTYKDWDDFVPIIWLSTDGVNWETVNTPTFDTGDRIHDLVRSGDTLVAVGSTGGWEVPTAAVWTSNDGGLTWAQSSLPSDPTALPSSAMHSVAVGPNGLLAVGARSSSDGSWGAANGSESVTLYGSIDLAIWSSPDGQAWVEHPPPTTPGHESALDVVWGPAGFLVSSFTTIDKHQGNFWLTLDGSELTQIEDHNVANSLMTVTVATPAGYTGIGDPEFHWLSRYDGLYPTPEEKEPQFLEIWKLDVTKAGG